MTLVITSNVVGQRRGEPVVLPNRRRRLSTIVARHKPPADRRFIVSVHRKGEVAFRPNDRAVRLRADWPRTLVGPNDVVLITVVPLKGGFASIGLAIASIALIAIAPYAAPGIAGFLGAGVSAGVVQAGLVVGGIALSFAAQASAAAKKKTENPLYSVSGGGNIPKANARRPLLYGRSWSSPPLSQKDYFSYDGDTMVLVKRMTLGIGKFQIHRVRVGDALYWDEASGLQSPFNLVTGPLGAAFEILYETPSAISPGDVITSTDVGGQEMPRVGGNPEWTPWFRLCPPGVTADAMQVSHTYPAIYRTSSAGAQRPTVAAVTYQAREINPTTGNVIGPEFVIWRSDEGGNALTVTPLRRSVNFRLPKPNAAYEIRAQNAYPDPAGFIQENRASWDEMVAFKDDVRVRPQTTEICMRVRAGKGLTVTAFSDITVDATRIVPVWDGSAWVEQPASKAVWAFCDLVRAEYGLNQPDGVDADKALYYANLLPSFDTYDGQLPEVSSFWEAAAEVLQPLRADPVKIGAIHSFVRDESRAGPRHVLTRRQIIRDSGGATYKTKVEGSDVIVEFDRDGDPKRPDEVRYAYGPQTRTPKRYKVAGIRDGNHAQKHAAWLALVAVFRGAERRITTEWDGRLVFPGDHILSDLWFFRDKQAYGVSSRDSNVLQLDVTANVPTAWGYVSIRTRVGREWGILRARGVGPRGLELHPNDVPALEAQTGLPLASVLARDTQGPTTVVLGDLTELQESYVARSAVPSDADHVQIEMVRDDIRIWQILGETVYQPAPISDDGLEEPLTPQISVLHARCDRIETGIEVIWGVSVTRGARNYEADISYDQGQTWDVLSPFGPASTGRAQMRQVDGPVSVRARAYGRTGLHGDYITTTFTTVAPVIDGRQVGIINLPPIKYVDLDAAVQTQIDRLNGIQKKAEDAAAAADKALTDALARLDILRKSLARDPAVRQGLIDPIIADVRQDIDMLTQAATRNAQDVSAMRDALATAGLETIPAQGRVRFYAIEALQTSVGSTISNFSVTVDALQRKIELYGSVQTGDLSGLITSITTVQTTLNALQGTITNYVSAAQFNPLADRVSSAENKLDAQAASIEAKASLTLVNGQGIRLTTAEQRISASEGRIFQAVQATAGSQFDLALLPQTLSGFFDFIQRQQGALSQQFATATTNIAASIDDAGRSTASVKTELLVFKGDASAQFVDLVTAVADTNSALVTRTTALQADIGSTQALIASETTVRAAADSAQTSQLAAASSRLGAAEASIASEATTRATADSAQTSQLAGAVSRLGTAEASIASEAMTRANADGAISTRVDGLTATVGQNSAGITSLAQVQANDRSASASQFAGVTARFGTVENRAGALEGRAAASEANVYSLSVSTASADAALGQRLDVVNGRVGSVEGAVATEASVRLSQDNAIVGYVNSVNAKTDAANAGVANEASARASGDAASASSINELYARNNIGTAFGRFGMTATAAPSGVSVRLAAQVSTDSYGQQRNAGFFLDLMPDGTSRFVVDANYFLLTANGGLTYPFQFDGSTLTIPNLRVTNSALLPGSVSQSGWGTSGSPSADFQVSCRANSRISIIAMFDGQPSIGFASLNPGKLQIIRDGAVIRETPISFYIAGNNDNRAAFSISTTTFVVDIPGAGTHSYRINNSGNQGPVSFKWEELAA